MKLQDIQPGKHYRLTDGTRFRCYATDGGGGVPVHGAIWDSGWRAVTVQPATVVAPWSDNQSLLAPLSAEIGR